jgi:ArsR family transcriptional regulator
MTPRFQDLERLFRALADTTRLRILALLSGGEVCVCHIHESLEVPQPTASRHLAYLRRAGLVEARRDGLWAHYRIARPRDAAVRAALDAALHAIGHVPATEADERRLGRHLFRPSPHALQLPVVSCCAAGVTETATAPRTRDRGRRRASTR